MSNQLKEIHSDAIVAMVKKGKRKLKRPEVGDLFTLEIESIGFVHGMVAKNEIEFAKGQTDFNIIYIYKDITKRKEDKVNCSKNNLLFSPFVVNDMAWRQGYFQTYTQLPQDKIDIFERYCFFSGAKGQYENEQWEPCEKFEPCSDLVLSSSLTIAIRVYSYLNPETEILY
ncbi:immunity 26 domain-containing protein [Photorhabdus temperata]|uniref:Immunity protein 26 of polymorphic toxin system n=1 Tax=Photorhabdus temperata subsp. temperata Meg1 TaxID=1393735 RepID=A0A081RVU6_PHOTE|nr:Imm26 family immunity protein [Photorhabdus temperata]KER02799.1 hypothetical protein MEG1DRAFT_02528 [Photorhabdus temperata subsp. temperata Meg1]MCT8346472.1 immunity 26 domain-containing protein [Photorhabdus temperata]